MCINIYAYICAYVHIYVYIRCITTINEKEVLNLKENLEAYMKGGRGRENEVIIILKN